MKLTHTARRSQLSELKPQQRQLGSDGRRPENRKADRNLLIILTEILCVSKGRLRRDLCGHWIISGRRGHILTDGVDTYAYLPAGTARRWNKAKQNLNFLTVTQDGDDEGILRLGENPTPTQVEMIRKAVGLRKVSPVTDEVRASLLRTGFPRGKLPVQTGIIASSGVAATSPLSCDQTSINELSGAQAKALRAAEP
jgi:hypothetical protein